MRITHFTFEFGFRYQGGNRVDNQNVDGAGTYQSVSNFQSLFTGIRLRNQQAVNVYADFLGISRVKRVFGVDKSTGSAFFLRLGNDAQGEGGFTGTFRPEDFYDTAFGQTADA